MQKANKALEPIDGTGHSASGLAFVDERIFGMGETTWRNPI
jgi:hypothetical protein